MINYPLTLLGAPSIAVLCKKNHRRLLAKIGCEAIHEMYSHVANTWVYFMKFYHKILGRRTKKCMVLFSRENYPSHASTCKHVRAASLIAVIFTVNISHLVRSNILYIYMQLCRVIKWLLQCNVHLHQPWSDRKYFCLKCYRTPTILFEYSLTNIAFLPIILIINRF